MRSRTGCVHWTTRNAASFERLACNVARRLAHLPLAGIRAAALHAEPDALEAFFAAAKSRARPH